MKPVLLFSCVLISIIPGMMKQGLSNDYQLAGELKIWHPLILTFTGPSTAESAEPNPFTDYNLTITFQGPQSSFKVPGYYCADGNAGQTGATSGSKWRVHFTPDKVGDWQFRVSFRMGKDLALKSQSNAGTALSLDGLTGEFKITSTDKSGRDFYGRGFLNYVGEHYMQFSGSKGFFIKMGAGSPENFLAYADFDGTYDRTPKNAIKRKGEAQGRDFLHTYEPHIRDFKTGDPSWQNGKGKGIIGALNYLASKGVNSVYFLTMNVNGDGDDIWPWTGPTEYDRFDCSKLDQWEIVFSHMDRLGIIQHLLQQETENDQLLDGGELGPNRKLYYRELIARFSHHPALVWNLGEENTNTDQQRKAFCRYIRALDAYNHPIFVHTYPGQWDDVYTPLLGFDAFEGPSLQDNAGLNMHDQVKKWREQSQKAGRKWVVMQDEQLEGSTGVKPDTLDYWHETIRHHYLWGSLMAGAAGVDWYFGYKWENNDLNCEDWRSRDHMWNMTRYAVEFFHAWLPFTDMHPADELTVDTNDYVFALPGQVYSVYIPSSSRNILNLNTFNDVYAVSWFNPRTGGAPKSGTHRQIHGPGSQNFGYPPRDFDKDWVALIHNITTE